MAPLIENSVKTLVEIIGGNVDTGKSFDIFKFALFGGPLIIMMIMF